MRSVKIGRKVLPNDNYKSFLSELEHTGATLAAKTVQHGTQAVEIMRGVVSFDPDLMPTESGKRKELNVGEAWQAVLDVLHNYEVPLED